MADQDLYAMTLPFARPSGDDHRRFLISFLFSGSLRPGPEECVARAYRDFSRTATGITAGAQGLKRKRSAHRLVHQLLDEAVVVDWTAERFDVWHALACARICEHYAKRGYPQFRIGQAQKWLNMSVKYLLSLAEAGVYELSQPCNLWEVAHAPLDDFILKATGAYDGVPTCYPWSQMADYALYMSVQKWIRKKYPCASALDIEFHVYNTEAARRRRA